MKKGHRNLLGRKNRSLFDTGVKMKDVDNGDLVLSSSAIPESGTASVRARPTVKHHISSDSFQGFAVPTPTVPVLPPPANGPKVNGSVGVHHNGLVPFARDLQEDDVFVPPPPSVAPPPPPGMSILPPPDFMGDLACPDLPSPRAPPFSAPKFPPPPPPPSDDLASLRPPPMSPPKPPSTCSSGGESSLSVSPSSGVPEPPLFAPLEPPSSERQPRTPKVPPPKPVRLSSISTQDMPSWTPPPPPTSQTTTLSTFNPQNAAKVYSVPAASILSGYEEHDPRPKHLLLLEDSGPVVAHRSKPPPEDVPDLQENSKPPEPVQAPPPQPKGKVEPAQEVVEKPLVAPQEAPVPPQETPVPPRSVAGAQVGPNTSRPVEAGKFSPLLDRKLRSLKAVEAVGAREGPAASPLALLMAAKQRDKNKWRTSQEHGGKEELPEATSGGGVPESSSETSEEAPVAGKMAAAPVETPATESPPENAPPSPATESKEVIMPLLPPPPEFDDPDDVPEPPPAVLPPPPLPAPPPPPKPGPAVRAKPEAKPKPPPTRLSANQVTLLSILQKKMLEMDHKISPTKDGEPAAAAAAAASDDWGAAPAEEDAKVPVVPRAAPQTRSPPIQPAAGLDLRELEDKVAQKHQEASKRRNSSTGVQSKHKYGMTFTIRPGTKQPITPYSREDSL